MAEFLRGIAIAERDVTINKGIPAFFNALFDALLDLLFCAIREPYKAQIALQAILRRFVQWGFSDKLIPCVEFVHSLLAYLVSVCMQCTHSRKPNCPTNKEHHPKKRLV